MSFSSLRAKFNAFSKTFTGKLVLSAARAFIGVFVAAEAQIFNALVNLVNSHDHAHWSVLASLILSLGAAGLTAAVRAVQHFLFEK